MRTPIKNSPKVLGLDISTKTIGWALFDIKTQELLELTHVSPRPKSKDTEENKMLELILKSEIFKTKLEDYKKLGIVSVIIEEPLLNSNNVYTIQTLLRFNTLICKTIYDIIGIVPEFISTYNSRKFAFPELVKENDKNNTDNHQNSKKVHVLRPKYLSKDHEFSVNDVQQKKWFGTNSNVWSTKKQNE